MGTDQERWRRLRRRVALAAATAATGAVSAGCGGSAERPSPPPSAAPAPTHETPTITQPGEKRGSLDQVSSRLEAAGYTPEEDETSGNAVAKILVDDVKIVGYRSSADASEDKDGIASAFAGKEGRGIVKVVGTRIYWTAQERNLKPAERKEFKKIVSVGEGR